MIKIKSYYIINRFHLNFQKPHNHFILYKTNLTNLSFIHNVYLVILITTYVTKNTSWLEKNGENLISCIGHQIKHFCIRNKSLKLIFTQRIQDILHEFKDN